MQIYDSDANVLLLESAVERKQQKYFRKPTL